MSWPNWNTGWPAGQAAPAAPALSTPAVPPPATNAIAVNPSQYTAEQWASMQQQNWQQWMQWQQQYQQWQQQYGEQYQKSIGQFGGAPVTAPVAPVAPVTTQPPLPQVNYGTTQPPLPYATSSTTAAPPLPPDQKPPPPPEQFSQPPPNMNSQPLFTQPPPGQFNKPPPITGVPPPANAVPPPSLLSLKLDKPSFEQPATKRKSEDITPVDKRRAIGPGTWVSTPETKPRKANPNEISEAEKKFDEQFKAWEEQFNKWKEQNANHPDKTQYRQYEAKWEAWRNQLLERREQMRKKRMGIVTPKATPAKPDSNIPTCQSDKNQEIVTEKPESITEQESKEPDLFSAPPKEQRQRRNRRSTSSQPETENSFDFTKSDTKEGIPGLDLVEKEVEIIDDAPKSGPDLAAISRGIDSILGDQNLKNIISLVSQQKQANERKISQEATDHIDLQNPALPQTNLEQGGDFETPVDDLSKTLADSSGDFQKPEFNNSRGDFNRLNSDNSSGNFARQDFDLSNFDTRDGFNNDCDDRFDNKREGFNNQRAEFANQRGKIINQRGGFDNVRGGFNNQQMGFQNQRSRFYNQCDELDNPREGFENQRNIFDDQRSGFGNQRGGFNTQRGGFNNQRGGFNNQRGGFDSQRGDFDNQRGGVNNQRGDFGNQRGGFNNQRGGFNNQRDDFDNNQDRFNTQRGNFDDLRGEIGNPRDSLDNLRGEFKNQRGNFNDRNEFNKSDGDTDFDQRGGLNNQRGGFNNPRGAFGNQRGGFNLRGGFDNQRGGRAGFNQPVDRTFDSQSDRESFGNQRAGFDNQPGGFNNQRGGFNNNRGGFDNNRGGFGNNRGGFDNNRGGLDNNRGGFGNNRGGFDNNRGGFGNNRGGFDNNRGGFDNNKGEFDNNRGGFKNNRGGFDNNRGGFDNERGEFDNNRFDGPEPVNDSLQECQPGPGSDSSRFSGGFNQTNRTPGLIDQAMNKPPGLWEIPNKNCDMFLEGPNTGTNNPRGEFTQNRQNPNPNENLRDGPVVLENITKTPNKFNVNIIENKLISTGNKIEENWEGDILVPATVVDYGHKSLPDRDEDVVFIEPVQTFDYNHSTKNVPKTHEKPWQQNRSNERDKPRDSRNWRDNRDNRDTRDKRDNRDTRDQRDNRDGRGDNRDFRGYRESRDVKHNQDSRDNRDSNEKRDFLDRRNDRNEDFPQVRKDSDRRQDNRDEELSKKETVQKEEQPQVASLFPAVSKQMITKDVWPRKESKENETKPQSQNITLIEDLLNLPGRTTRPPRIVIILRGPPGSGKTFLAKLIKDRETSQGGSAPRILSLDDYFMVEVEKETTDPETGRKMKLKEMVYEYEQCMETAYLSSLVKAFKKTINDGYFSFIIVDCVNNQVKQYEEMWSFAKSNGFQVYVCQMELDVAACAKRNVHNRTEEQIAQLVKTWEETPGHHLQLDVMSLLQAACISEVEMDIISDDDNIEQITVDSNPGDEEKEPSEAVGFKSKWETMEHTFDKLARLDGINKPLRHSTQSMEDYLQLDDWKQPEVKPGQKRVRWADLVEKNEQEKMRAIGFVVGQTDWNRMMDPSQGSNALTQTKFIESTRKY